MSRPTSITLGYKTKHKLETLKLEVQGKEERKVSWDEFFNKIHIRIKK
jgi:hypothetical protein